MKEGDILQYPYSKHKVVKVNNILMLERLNDGELSPLPYNRKILKETNQ